jgi:hypothetical protein
MLLQIPKGLLLIQICSFLTMPELTQLSSTCMGLRRTIFSPLGWKFILRIKTPYPVQLLSPESNFKAKMRKVAQEAMEQALQPQTSSDEAAIAA